MTLKKTLNRMNDMKKLPREVSEAEGGKGGSSWRRRGEGRPGALNPADVLQFPR